MKKHPPPRWLTFHCSAHPEGRDVTVAQMNAIARAKFGRKSYHWICTRDGVLHRNLEDHEVGAHTGGANTRNIGVVYIGGLAKDGKTCKDTRTPEQRAALRKLADEYRAKVPGIILRGHRDWSPDLDGDGKVEKHEWLKCCPSFDVATEL